MMRFLRMEETVRSIKTDEREQDNRPEIVKKLCSRSRALTVKEYTGNKDCQRYIELDDAIKIATNDTKFNWSSAYLSIGELNLSKPEFNEIVRIIESNIGQ